ncbi:MAG: arginine--tRNA ligase [Anaerolineae bacterium]
MKPLPKLHASLVEEAIKAAQAAGDLPAFDLPAIPITPAKKPELGDYACPIAMALAKNVGRKPLEIAETIAKHMPQADFVGAVEVAPPGFINFRMSEDWLRQQVNVIAERGEDLYVLDMGAGKRAQVEFLSANPTGPITIGRSRGAILGDGTARVLEAAGYEVVREYYFNNAGVQMRNLGSSLRIRYLEALGKDVEVPGPDDEKFYQGDYLIDFAKDLVAEQGDALVDADWQVFKSYGEKKMFEWIKSTMDRVDIHFDVFFNENDLYDSGKIWEVLDELGQRGYIYESVVRESESDEVKELNKHLKPAKWFRSTREGDAEDRVVVKSNGEPTYTLPDIAYHMNKIDRDFHLMVNILGADHQTEARVVRYGLQAMGYDPSHLHVTHMQMVRAVRDGKEVKMSTRRGVYDTLDELIDMTSPDAVRYFLLQRSPDSQLDFDLDLAVKESNENPVYYIQYAYVRCAGIFREAEARGLTVEGADLSLLGEEELRFIKKCLELLEVIEMAATELAPHKVAYYALDLANQFHPLYDRVRVFSDGVEADVAKARLRFYEAARITFRRVLRLMGMSTPERM